MKYLVVGTLPPPVLGRSASLLGAVSRLENAGHDVTVRPIGVGNPASRISGLAAWCGLDVALTLLRTPDRAGTKLVLQVEPAIVGEHAGRVRRAAALFLLAGALTGWRQVEIRVDSFADLPSGVGGRAAGILWKRADYVVVSSAALGEAIRAAGVIPEALIVDPDGSRGARRKAPAKAAEAWPADGDDPDVQEVLAVVRRRAAIEQTLSGRSAPDAAAAMLAAGAAAGGESPFGPLEPVVRFVYERPALREPARRVRRAIQRGR